MKSREQFPFPDEETLKEIREKLSDPKYEGCSMLLPEDANEIDRAKFQVSQMMIKFKREGNLSNRDLSEILAIDESSISNLLRGKIEFFSLESLIGYAEKLVFLAKSHHGKA